MLLGLDTSTSTASLALVATDDAPRTLVEHSWMVGQRHSVELAPRLEWLLSTGGVRADQLTGVAVATGPGSFNGLRVALSTAKSLCLALDLPLYGVPTLDVAAWGCAYAAGPLWALLEAGRGQLYVARYPAPTGAADGWGPLGGYHVLTPDELATQALEQSAAAPFAGALFAGEWRPETRAALAARLAGLGERVRFASPLRIRRAVWLVELALARAAHGLRDDPSTLEPLYLRRPAITRSGKRGMAPLSMVPEAAPGGDSPSEREDPSHALHS